MKATECAYCVDANVLLRYLTQDVQDQYLKAESTMKAVENGDFRVFCDPVTLSEVVWALLKFYSLTGEQIWEGLAPIVKSDCFVLPDKPRYVRALELLSKGMDHYGDACACAAAMEKCGGKLLSFDKALSKVNGIQRLEQPTP